MSHGPSAASEKKGASDSVEELTRQIADCAVIRLVPEDDKVAVLEARIRQQSELIALLKQRADSTLHQLNSCELRCTELQASKDQLKCSLEEERRSHSTLSDRFNVLASNHEEMIRIKDSYKEERDKLREEVVKMRGEKDTLHSSVVTPLEKLLAVRNKEIDALRTQCSCLENNISELKKNYAKQTATLDKEISSLQHTIEADKESEKQLKKQLARGEEESERSKTKSAALKEHVRKMEDTCKHFEQELSSYKERLSTRDQEITDLKRKTREQEEMVSRDECVMRLRKELVLLRNKLESVTREFMAYKQHSAEQLKQERELNQQLRHLAE